MALRTEGVGRGVNWQGLSNLANIIQRGGETQAEIFRGIGESIVKRRQFKEQMAAEQKRADEARAFDMASLMAQMGDREAAREQSQKQFDVTAAFERQKAEADRKKAEAAMIEAQNRAANDTDARAVQRALMWAQHGIQIGDQSFVDKSKDALKRIIPQMMAREQEKVRGVSAPVNPWEEVLNRTIENKPAFGEKPSFKGEGFTVYEQPAPEIEMPTGPSTYIANRFRQLRTRLASESLTDAQANEIVNDSESMNSDVLAQLDAKRKELRALSYRKNRPSNYREIEAELKDEITRLEMDAAHTSSELSSIAEQAGLARQRAVQKQVDQRNKNLRADVSPEELPILESVLADPNSKDLTYDQVVRSVGLRLKTQQERLASVSEAVMRVSKAVADDATAAVGTAPLDGADTNDKGKMAADLKNRLSNLSRRHLEIIATSNNLSYDYVLAARSLIEQSIGHKINWNEKMADEGAYLSVLKEPWNFSISDSIAAEVARRLGLAEGEEQPAGNAGEKPGPIDLTKSAEDFKRAARAASRNAPELREPRK